jgi:chemotaxis receptor (MCP) glutamine deamidase CheD
MAGREFLHPGECRLFTAPTAVEMVLGSCVAVCLWREDLAASAVCHAVLPARHLAANEPAPNGRYVDEAIEIMLVQLQRVPGHVPIIAGIAGACWSALAGEVARRNSDAARRALMQRKIPRQWLSQVMVRYCQRQSSLHVGIDCRAAEVMCQILRGRVYREALQNDQGNGRG